MSNRLWRRRRIPALVSAGVMAGLGAWATGALIIDVRAISATGGAIVVNSKNVDVTSATPGDVISFSIFALISGQDADPSNEGLLQCAGSFLSPNDALDGSVRGNLLGTRTLLVWNGPGSSNGMQANLDADGDLDLGSNNDESAAGFFAVRASSAPEPVSGSTLSLGTLTMTLTSTGLAGAVTEVNFRPRGHSIAATWFEDNMSITSGNVSLGQPVKLNQDNGNRFYTGPDGGSWSNATSWSSVEAGGGAAGVPTANKDATVRGAITKTIIFDGNYSAASPLRTLMVDASGGATITLSQSSSNTMAAVAEVIGDTGKAVYTQSAGQNLVAGSIQLGRSSSGRGTYNLSGGTLVVGGIAALGGTASAPSGGTGLVNVLGGSMSVAGTLHIWSSGSTAFNLSAGTASVGALDTHGDPSRLTANWTGGTLNLAPAGNSGIFIDTIAPQSAQNPLGSFLNINESSKALALGIADRSNASSMFVGFHGNGSVNLSAGSLTVHGGLKLAGAAGRVGTMSMSGGALSTLQSVIGEFGTATFTQSQGTHTAGPILPIYTPQDAFTIATQSGSQATYELSGGTLQVLGDASVGGFHFNGGGFAGGNGTLIVSSTGSMNVTGKLTVWNNGTLLYNGGSLSLGALEVQGGRLLESANGGRLLKAGSVATSAGGIIDLNDNDLQVTGGNTYAQIRAQIVSARAGGSWTGSGLTSSAAKIANPKNKTLGVITGQQFHTAQGAAATFDGSTVADSDVLVKFTYYGDTDFNGIVDFDDYSRTDSGFNSSGTDWFHGDFDYNNIVDFDDYSLIDLAFNTQSGTLARALRYLDGSDRSAEGMNEPALQMVQAHFNQFGNAYATSALNAVPEPSSAALTGVFAVLAYRRRRHQLSHD
jgi:hypothetical protein